MAEHGHYLYGCVGVAMGRTGKKIHKLLHECEQYCCEYVNDGVVSIR